MTSDDLLPWFILGSVVLLMGWLAWMVAVPIGGDIYRALGLI